MKILIDYTSYRSLLKTKREDNVRKILDPIRKKMLVLTPEEFVRQLLLQFLIHDKNYNENRIGVEKKVVFNKMPKRCDILVYDQNMSPYLLVECKAPEVKLSDGTFRQIARYNSPLQVPYLLITNGIETYCCKMNYEEKSYEFINEIQGYPL